MHPDYLKVSGIVHKTSEKAQHATFEMHIASMSFALRLSFLAPSLTAVPL